MKIPFSFLESKFLLLDQSAMAREAVKNYGRSSRGPPPQRRGTPCVNSNARSPYHASSPLPASLKSQVVELVMPLCQHVSERHEATQRACAQPPGPSRTGTCQPKEHSRTAGMWVLDGLSTSPQTRRVHWASVCPWGPVSSRAPLSTHFAGRGGGVDPASIDAVGVLSGPQDCSPLPVREEAQGTWRGLTAPPPGPSLPAAGAPLPPVIVLLPPQGRSGVSKTLPCW